MRVAKQTVGTVIAVIVLVAWVNGEDAHGAPQPVNLRCELRVNPLGIGTATPRLSWQLQSNGANRGETQTAYQIQVGSAAGTSNLWDSAKVTSAETLDILYAGQPLTNGQRCFWQVRVYNGSNNVSAWSAPAQWSVGLLAQTNWAAQWIGYDAAYAPTPQQAADDALFNTSGLSWISYSGQTAQGGLHQSSLRKSIILPSSQTITNAVVALYADNAAFSSTVSK
jgi:alpha-L-rhamnosidase